MWRPGPHAVTPRGIVQALVERVRGREQRLVRPSENLPLLLLSYPSGALEVAEEIERAYVHTLPHLRAGTREPYDRALAEVHNLIVVLLRPNNVCSCLGHHHPRGTESRLTRRLESDLGSSIGEIDLAYEAIRGWTPRPISSLAAGDPGGDFRAIHFQAAVLAVLLHEIEHLTLPDASEHDIRARSDRFYAEAMEQLLAEESGTDYGMTSRRPPRP